MPASGERRVVYDHSVEGLFSRALGKQLTPACRRELADAGLDLSRKLRPQYGADEYERFVQIARKHLYPALADADAYRRMGRQFIDGYFETVVGAALKAVVRLLGPRRTVERLPQSFEGGTSYIHASLEKLGDCDYALRVNDVGRTPTFTQGSLERALEICGAADPSVEWTDASDGSVTYRVRWR